MFCCGAGSCADAGGVASVAGGLPQLLGGHGVVWTDEQKVQVTRIARQLGSVLMETKQMRRVLVGVREAVATTSCQRYTSSHILS